MKTRLLTAALVAAATVVTPVAHSSPPPGTGPTAVSSPLTRAPADDNPVRGTWGVYKGRADGAYPAYRAASGTRKKLLAEVALRPRVRWYGLWVKRGEIADRIRSDIRQMQHGDRSVVAPIAVFRQFHLGGNRIDAPMRRADRRAYRRWIDQAARGIGGSRVLLILEPDLPRVFSGWRPAVRMKLVRYAARVFGSLPRTATYLDAGAVDWRTVSDATSLMKRTGVEHVRGFVVGGTHYTGPSSNIRYGNRVRRALARAGIPGRHFVVDTADNGRPFTGLWYKAHHPDGDFNNAEVCHDRDQRHCVALGIPPTDNVTADRWGFSDRVTRIARRHVDGFVWEGRPWLDRTKQRLALHRTLAIARYSRP